MKCGFSSGSLLFAKIVTHLGVTGIQRDNSILLINVN